MTVSFGELLGVEIREARETKEWTQLLVSELAFGDHQGERRVRDYESGRVKRPQAKVYMPICEALGISRRRIAELKALAGDAKALNLAEIEELKAEKGSLEEALSNLRDLSRTQLYTLAELFEINTYFDLQEDVLLHLLSQKAEDYLKLKAEVEAIDDNFRQASKLKPAAKLAIENGNLEEVEELLKQVQQLELEGGLRTANLRANNALLRGHVERAFEIFNAAADSFGGIDIFEPAIRRLQFEKVLFAYGIRYDGLGLEYANRLAAAALNSLDRIKFPEDWIEASNRLATCLIEQGSRSSGEVGSNFLKEAEETCLDVIKSFDQFQYGDGWARAQENLGKVKRFQGVRDGSKRGIELLHESILAYKAAIAHHQKENRDSSWAKLQSLLATTLNYLGDRFDDERGNQILEEAIEYFESSLAVLNVDENPLDWGVAQNNLAVALYDLGRRLDGSSGLELCVSAVAANDAAMTVRTKESNPIGWAQCQNNKAIALTQIGVIRGDVKALEDAIKSCASSIKVRSKESYPLLWAVTQTNMSRAMMELAELSQSNERIDALQTALLNVEEVFDVLDEVNTKMYFDWALELKQDMLSRLMKG